MYVPGGQSQGGLHCHPQPRDGRLVTQAPYRVPRAWMANGGAPSHGAGWMGNNTSLQAGPATFQGDLNQGTSQFWRYWYISLVDCPCPHRRAISGKGGGGVLLLDTLRWAWI